MTGLKQFGYAASVMLWTAAVACSGSNLVVNGSFDNPDDPLYAWKCKYDLPGESWYFQNHEHVKVVASESGRNNVLALWGDDDILNQGGQGTKVDSKPIPVKPGGRYRLAVTARSSGPDCRIMVEGYQWKPGIKPHPDPKLHELRVCFKSSVVYFGSTKGGSAGGVGRGWETASQTFPQAHPSEEEKDALSRMEFLVVHIVAIKGSEGTLYVDDVTVERLN